MGTLVLFTPSVLRVLELLEAAVERSDEVFVIVDSSEDPDEGTEGDFARRAGAGAHISRAVLDMQVSRWTREGGKRIALAGSRVPG
jgi:hypothetical protein